MTQEAPELRPSTPLPQHPPWTYARLLWTSSSMSTRVLLGVVVLLLIFVFVR